MDDFSGRSKIWVAFEGARTAKPVSAADLEFHAQETENENDLHRLPSWVEELFNVQKRLEDGSILALHEGIRLCYLAQIPLPDWLQSALENLVVCAAKGEPFEAKGVGRSNSTTGKMREGMKRHLRKDAVKRVRAYQALEPCMLAFLLLPVGLRRLHNGKPLPDLGSSVERAIHFAEVGLRGTFAQASFETVRKAYFSPDEDDCGPWPFSSSETLRAVGIETDSAGQYFPEGCAPRAFPHFDLHNAIFPEGQDPAFPYSDLPDALVPDKQELVMDPVSEAYLDEASRFNDFDDFIEAQRKKRAE